MILRAGAPEFFATELLQLLERAARSIGRALEGHAQRLQLDHSLREAERSQRASHLLSEALKVATHATTEKKLLGEACQVVVNIGGYALCWMGLLLNDSSQTLELRAHAGRGVESFHDFRLSLADPDVSDSVTMTVLRSGKSLVRLPRQHADEVGSMHAFRLGLRAQLGLPLLRRGKVMGVIFVGADSEDAFSSAEVRNFEELAQELSLGLEQLRARQAQSVAEQRLTLNLHRFQAILSSRYAGILVMGADEHVQFCNTAFCRMFDLAESPDDLIGLPDALLQTMTRAALANPERELKRIRDVIERADPADVEEISISGGRTYLISFTPIMLDEQRHGHVWHFIDITERKIQEAEVERLAYFDPVTELPNRRRFLELMEQGLADVRLGGTQPALGVIGIDGFKHVNDQLGHAGGDAILRHLARRIADSLSEMDVLARLDGDVFSILLHAPGDERNLRDASNRILEALRQPVAYNGEVLHLSASLGWVPRYAPDIDAETHMRHAHLAMFAAKEQGRDRDQIYSEAIHLAEAGQRSMKARVASGLDDGSLVLVFQPIVHMDAATGTARVISVEALLRLRDGAQGLLPPAFFHHALDDITLARPIGRYVLRAALRVSETWLKMGLRLPISVNISTRHLMHSQFIADLDEAMAEHPQVGPSLLGIEITETGPLLDPARARLVIDECRARQHNVSLDDFGTGSASLSHVQQMDVGTLKIDQSFVRDILEAPRSIAIAAGILTTAQMLGITVIAEGIETEAQGELLISLGCRQLQGYAISQPMAAEAIPPWIASWTSHASWRM